MGVAIGLVEPHVRDVLSVGDCCLTVLERLHLNPGQAFGGEDYLLVCSPRAGVAPPVSPKTFPENSDLADLPAAVVTDPMGWHALLSAGFEEISIQGKNFPDEVIRALIARFPLTQV